MENTSVLVHLGAKIGSYDLICNHSHDNAQCFKDDSNSLLLIKFAIAKVQPLGFISVGDFSVSLILQVIIADASLEKSIGLRNDGFIDHSPKLIRNDDRQCEDAMTKILVSKCLNVIPFLLDNLSV